MSRTFSIIFMIFPLLAAAQKDELNNGTRFQNGIYMTADDFMNGQPLQFDDSVVIHNFTNETSGLMTGTFEIIEKIEMKTENGKWQKIELNTIWGLVIEGELFIQTGRYKISTQGPGTRSGYNVYGQPTGIEIDPLSAALYTRQRTPYFIFNNPTRLGSICLLTLSTSSYNNENLKEKMLKIKTGELVGITVHNIRRFIADDKELYKEFQSERQTRESAYSFITQYNMRNKTYLPAAEGKQQAGE